jgi:hypothetical protein
MRRGYCTLRMGEVTGWSYTILGLKVQRVVGTQDRCYTYGLSFGFTAGQGMAQYNGGEKKGRP